jgi:hypothetical protein
VHALHPDDAEDGLSRSIRALDPRSASRCRDRRH